ncbi:MAG TPA: hypothetical protein DC049_09240 [Spirochaetia bacterium]|nr:hypothetical protein [Spirochaetia bacterium]
MDESYDLGLTLGGKLRADGQALGYRDPGDEAIRSLLRGRGITNPSDNLIAETRRGIRDGMTKVENNQFIPKERDLHLRGSETLGNRKILPGEAAREIKTEMYVKSYNDTIGLFRDTLGKRMFNNYSEAEKFIDSIIDRININRSELLKNNVSTVHIDTAIKDLKGFESALINKKLPETFQIDFTLIARKIK